MINHHWKIEETPLYLFIFNSIALFSIEVGHRWKRFSRLFFVRCSISRELLPVIPQFVLHEFSPSICRLTSWSSKVVWPPESRAVGPSVIFAPCHMACPSEFSLECIDVGVFEFGVLADGGTCNFLDQFDTECSSFHGSLGRLELLFFVFSHSPYFTAIAEYW